MTRVSQSRQPTPPISPTFPILSALIHSTKISVTRPVPVPVHVPAIVKRHAMAGSGLGRYVSVASPRVSEGAGGGRAGNFPAGFFPENFLPDFFKIILPAPSSNFFQTILRNEKSPTNSTSSPPQNTLFSEFTTSPIRARMGPRSPKTLKQSLKRASFQ